MEIIAEIGQNHNGDMGLAREMIFEAAAKVLIARNSSSMMRWRFSQKKAIHGTSTI